jgi:hypothetical protein
MKSKLTIAVLMLSAFNTFAPRQADQTFATED